MVLERPRMPADHCFWRHTVMHLVPISLDSPLKAQVWVAGPKWAQTCKSAASLQSWPALSMVWPQPVRSLGPCWLVQAQALIRTAISEAQPKLSIYQRWLCWYYCNHVPTHRSSWQDSHNVMSNNGGIKRQQRTQMYHTDKGWLASSTIMWDMS